MATAPSKYGGCELTKNAALSNSFGIYFSNLYAVIFHSGKPYHVEFVDTVRFNSQGNNAQLKEFLDSGHVQKHVVQHQEQQGK